METCLLTVLVEATVCNSLFSCILYAKSMNNQFDSSLSSRHIDQSQSHSIESAEMRGKVGKIQ